MRCVIFIAVCLVVLALSEARSFGSRKLAGDLAARLLKKGAPQLKAGLLSGISAKRSHEWHPEGDLIASAQELLFGVEQILDPSVWENVPEEAWEMSPWCQFKGEPWFDNVYMQAALGAIVYVKMPEYRAPLDWVYKIFGEASECIKMQDMGKQLTEMYGDKFENEYRFVDIAIYVMSSQCDRRQGENETLVKELEAIECDAEMDTTQVERHFSSIQKKLFRKRRGEDEEDEEDEESDIQISRTMFKTIQHAGKCLLEKSKDELCAKAINAVKVYTDGLVAEYEAKEKVGEIMCAELNKAVSDVKEATETEGLVKQLLVDLDFTADFEELVNESCGPPPADQPARDLNVLKELLRNLLVKK